MVQAVSTVAARGDRQPDVFTWKLGRRFSQRGDATRWCKAPALRRSHTTKDKNITPPTPPHPYTRFKPLPNRQFPC
ncbi:MAG: hypothetical protein ACR9NN_18130 [Nostochopsis sp.]